jgi:hypothetical protein
MRRAYRKSFNIDSDSKDKKFDSAKHYINFLQLFQAAPSAASEPGGAVFVDPEFN